MVVTFEITDQAEFSAKTAISDALIAYNVELLGWSNMRPLAILLHAEDGVTVIGGLWARTSFKWLYVELLFVPEQLRAHGLGRRLLQAAEAEARERDCHGSWLETFSVTAAGFYEKLGYRRFGVIPDYPPGNPRQFFLKNL